MGTKSDSASKENEQELTLEELFGQMEDVMNRMEAEEITLEDSFACYKQGMLILKKCNEKIDLVEKQVLVLDENGEEHEF